MKKINEALGYLDENFMDEAMAASHRPRLKRGALIAAACAVMLTIGAAAVSLRYFAPGVGIVYDSSVRVLGSTEKVTLGGIELDTVMMTDHGDGTGTLSVWGYRAEEVKVNERDAMQGIAPAELSDFSCIINGMEYERGTGSYGTSGFANHNFIDVPFTDTVTLKHLDYEVTLTLTDIDPTEVGGTIRFGKNALTLFPVSSTENIWAIEYYDELALALAKDATSYSVNAILRTIRDDGEVGSISGWAMLNGAEMYTHRAADVGNKDYGKGVKSAALKNLNMHFTFTTEADIPEAVLTLPKKGETAACDAVVYENNGIEVRVKSITYGENGITYETETLNKTGRRDIEIPFTYMELYVKRDIAYQNGTHWIEQKDAYTLVYNTADDKRKGAFIYDFENDTDIELVGGEEVVLRLKDITLEISGYDGSDDWFFNYEGNLGEVNFK